MHLDIEGFPQGQTSVPDSEKYALTRRTEKIYLCHDIIKANRKNNRCCASDKTYPDAASGGYSLETARPWAYGTGGSCSWQKGIATAMGVPQTLQIPLLTGSSIVLH
jgi:hypothetical protein